MQRWRKKCNISYDFFFHWKAAKEQMSKSTKKRKPKTSSHIKVDIQCLAYDKSYRKMEKNYVIFMLDKHERSEEKKITSTQLICRWHMIFKPKYWGDKQWEHFSKRRRRKKHLMGSVQRRNHNWCSTCTFVTETNEWWLCVVFIHSLLLLSFILNTMWFYAQ